MRGLLNSIADGVEVIVGVRHLRKILSCTLVHYVVLCVEAFMLNKVK